ncbi:DNA polymerase Y family protein [Sphingomonas sp. 1P06PA]|uniref:Y-family DNA polymerase n=1 Tax=Sphingomonas sp. 1P06PA TaxID=554121 RepID=UPI0039A44F6F
MIEAVSTNEDRRRYLALWCPRLPTDRLHGAARADSRPLVVVDRVRNAVRLVALDAQAARLGLAIGTTLADARARYPDLDVADADPQADDRLLMRLVARAGRLTPMVAPDLPHGLMLDISGCAHLFGGEDGLHAEALALAMRHGLSARATIADTPDMARALCRFARVAIVPPGGGAARVRPLPVAALGTAPDVVTALSRAGLKTIGDLADRPLRALVARFGADLATRLARILGEEDARITPLRAQPPVRIVRRFAEPIGHADAIEATIADLTGEAAQLLVEQGLGGRGFLLDLFRSDGAVRRLAVESSRALRDPSAVMRLFRERIDTLADPIDPGFGFDLVALAVTRTEPLDAAQPNLDGRACDEEALAALVDRLGVRFGRDHVLRFVARDTHDPDREAGLSLAACGPGDLGWPAACAGDPPARPIHLFEPPQPIETMAEVPDAPPMRFTWRRVQHRVTWSEGPERIEPDWWQHADQEPAPPRDYYRVEDEAGRRFWIYREGRFGAARPPSWYLHGLFA